MNLDRFLEAEYEREQYNCLHFTRDVWLELTGTDISDALGGLLSGPVGTRALGRATVRSFDALAGPRDPCLVLFQSPATTPHIGVFVGGRVLHLSAPGARYVPVESAAFGFKSIRYIAPCLNK